MVPALPGQSGRGRGGGLPAVPSSFTGQQAQLRPMEPGERRHSEERVPEHKALFPLGEALPSKMNAAGVNY